MKKIKKISIVYSGTRSTDKMLSVVKKIIKDSGSEVVTQQHKEANKVFKKVATSDLIFVLGGDGTMIGSIRSLYDLKIPFWELILEL